VLGVALDPLELDAGQLRAAPARLEQLGRQVAGRDLRAVLRRGDRGVAGAGGDVEDPQSGADAARLDEPRPERQKERLDHGGVVAGCPHRAMTRLDCGVRRALLLLLVAVGEASAAVRGHRASFVGGPTVCRIARRYSAATQWDAGPPNPRHSGRFGAPDAVVDALGAGERGRQLP
jgi:hypothetical protein